MEKLDEILTEVIATKVRVEGLQGKLYGMGNDPGDIPAIRKHLEKINDKTRIQDDQIQSHETRLQIHHARIKFNRYLVGLVFVVVVSGGGLAKLLDLW